jgi:hypothetical protein
MNFTALVFIQAYLFRQVSWSQRTGMVRVTERRTRLSHARYLRSPLSSLLKATITGRPKGEERERRCRPRVALDATMYISSRRGPDGPTDVRGALAGVSTFLTC